MKGKRKRKGCSHSCGECLKKVKALLERLRELEGKGGGSIKG